MTSLDEHLTNPAIDLPEIELPRHQQQLRRALLTMAHEQSVRGVGFWASLIEYFTMSKKHLAVAVSTIAVVVVGVFGGLLYRNGTPRAQAKDLVNQATMTVSSLTPAQLDALMKQQGFDLVLSLKEAKAASDLMMLSAAQYHKESGTVMGPATDDTLKYMRYTDHNGSRVYLGIDDKKVPQSKEIITKDGQVSGMVQGTAIAVPDGQPGTINLPTGTPLEVAPGTGIQTITGSTVITK